MRRLIGSIVALTLSVVLPLSAQTPVLTVNLGLLNLGPISVITPIELDGRAGSEYLVQLDGPVEPPGPTWRVIYPGACVAPTAITIEPDDQFVDHNGDGRQEIMRFDVATQTVVFLAFPSCST